MKRTHDRRRIAFIGALFLIIMVCYIGRLTYLNTVGQKNYVATVVTNYHTRTEKIQAVRGNIYDRNGVALVTNAYRYSLLLDYSSLSKENSDINDIILTIRSLAVQSGESDSLATPRASLDYVVSPSGITFTYSSDFLNTSRGTKFKKLVSELNAEDGTLAEQANALMQHYGIVKITKDKKTKETTVTYHYSYEEAAILLVTRLDMDLIGFSPVQQYTMATGVSLDLITAVEEKITRGLTVSVTASREYHYPGYATHILGRVSRIPSDKVEYYTEKGYALDTYVGVSGAESAFEDYLRGVDGTLTITEDDDGNIVGTEVTTEPVAGQDIYLTIDIEMQMVAEKALAENIQYIRDTANPEKALTGEDASAGAITVEDLHTGELLASASYPTYNLATFSEDYEALASDETSPFVNRALNGRYAPGSTFKIGVAVAALSEGIITKDTVIRTEGEYRYYEDAGFTPRCWLYLLTGRNHGSIKVVEAIQESCNCFFYEVGRLLTIETMNEYCRHYGLGESTGIELPESTGILAGPDYRVRNGLGQWSPGDTITAAIGQSDNLFTPIQIGNYLSTILNRGKRYNLHVLKEVKNYDGTVEFEQSPVVADEIEISADILATVKEGMQGVMDNGSAASVFKGYPISVGGKTGTAQVYSDRSDNGIMVAFAPFDEPEIVVTCVIEQASGGTEAGYAIRDVFDYYFAVETETEQ